MGTITVQPETTKDPISLIGKEAGICWNSDTEDLTKNYQRGLNCIDSGHGRTMEYPQIYLIIDGYSARVIRELYTHIAGGPSRMQASTRYIDYKNFEFITPPSIKNNENFDIHYRYTMEMIAAHIQDLVDWGVPREDAAMLLPLGMATKIVFRTNLRQLLDMAQNRCCNRAYWEFRQIMKDIGNALSDYSDEWKTVINTYYHAKCEDFGYCPETKGCGRYKKKGEIR